MAKDLIIVDSCVLIKAFRKDIKAINDLKAIVGFTAYSCENNLFFNCHMELANYHPASFRNTRVGSFQILLNLNC